MNGSDWMRCENCKDEIKSCGTCGESFLRGERIKCRTLEAESHGEWRLHSHLNCGPHVALSRVIEWPKSEWMKDGAWYDRGIGYIIIMWIPILSAVMYFFTSVNWILWIPRKQPREKTIASCVSENSWSAGKSGVIEWYYIVLNEHLSLW